jgi:hypothetical protein
MKKKLLLLAVLGCLLYNQGNAQSSGTDSQTTPANTMAETNKSIKGPQKGTFFITPFYQYCSFGNLELISLSGKFTLPEKTVFNDFTDEEINDYNDNFGTAYKYSMTGLRIGYQLTEGLGVSVYSGIKHFTFESWKSEENKQSMTTEYPSFTTGVAVDYIMKVKSSLYAMALVSYNFTTSRSVTVNSELSEDVVTSRIKSSYYEANLALAYKLGRFTPYAGGGYTLQLIHPVITEQFTTNDPEGNPYDQRVEYDSHFRGDAIYGFAGLDFLLTPKIAVFARSTFFNLTRLSFGIKLTL